MNPQPRTGASTLAGLALLAVLVWHYPAAGHQATSSSRPAVVAPAGGRISLGQFVAAIVAQESGGNYQARSPAGALGRYQVMPRNVGPWSRETLGYPISTAEFLASPRLQDRIARRKLREYLDRYGPAGAAAAWYSGDPGRADDPSPVKGGPSVRQYVREVLARMGGR